VMISLMFLALCLFGAWLTWNVYFPSYAPGDSRSGASSPDG